MQPEAITVAFVVVAVVAIVVLTVRWWRRENLLVVCKYTEKMREHYAGVGSFFAPVKLTLIRGLEQAEQGIFVAIMEDGSRKSLSISSLNRVDIVGNLIEGPMPVGRVLSYFAERGVDWKYEELAWPGIPEREGFRNKDRAFYRWCFDPSQEMNYEGLPSGDPKFRELIKEICRRHPPKRQPG
jgi:hypothetical protein